ncbi:MAG: Butyrate kinase [Promethearchaeota archaeon]|nr:MAG: Butyrate kinase [Candidatus Lokiarchaeota archaeon]
MESTLTNTTVLGIDPGSKSWDFLGLYDDKIILDTSIPTRELIRTPQKCITIIKSLHTKRKIDLMVAPSGFGLPLKKSSELTEKDIFLTLLKFKKKEKEELLGLGKILNLIKKENVPGVIVPGVKHLPTVPRYRKINKIDMGTADKLCTTVVGIKDQMECYDIPPENTNFIMVEIGYGFTAVLAIEKGKIIDGIGGSNIMGFRACGNLDGELAYLIKEIKKENIYRGGVAYIAGYSNLSLKEISLLAEKDEQTKMAFQAYLSSVKKAVYAISSSFSSQKAPKEILLAGRGANIKYIQHNIEDALNQFIPVRLMKSYSQIAKRAAQGAAYIANGLLGGKYEPIIKNLEIRNASGSVLDDIFIPFNKDYVGREVNH